MIVILVLLLYYQIGKMIGSYLHVVAYIQINSEHRSDKTFKIILNSLIYQLRDTK